eukprot:scaffold390396_cov32-Prasinocladus_malaysianus.AAC.1
MRCNVRIFKCRPNLHAAIPNIIYGIESGNGLPEIITKEDKVRVELAEMAEKLDEEMPQSSEEKYKALDREAKRRGYLFQELVMPSVPLQFGAWGREMTISPSKPRSELVKAVSSRKIDFQPSMQ